MQNLLTTNTISCFKTTMIANHVLRSESPSRKDGISYEIEQSQCIAGCELIEDAGILLRLPQVVMATGQNLLHRFYCRKSILKFDVFTVSMGCVLLASKLEEHFKNIREVVFIFHRIFLRRKNLNIQPLDLGSQLYTTWKNELITMEMYILKELGFSLYEIMDHPHKYLLYFVKVLNGNEALAQTAWNYLNDSLRLNISLEYSAEKIACAAMYLAARKLQYPLPRDNSWLSIMGGDLQSVLIICDRILSLYTMDKVQWLDSLVTVEYLDETEAEAQKS